MTSIKVKLKLRRLLLFCLLLPCAYLLAETAAQSAQTKSKEKSVHAANAGVATESEGEKRFRANCGRCHNAPEDLSPREARAVVRQMRVRAILSAEDEKLILEYIAP